MLHGKLSANFDASDLYNGTYGRFLGIGMIWSASGVYRILRNACRVYRIRGNWVTGELSVQNNEEGEIGCTE